MACDWLADIAQVKHANVMDDPRHPDPSGFQYKDWRGIIKGEYDHASRQWSFYGPSWHTGQAASALAGAAKLLAEPRYLEAARLAADSIVRQSVADPSDPDFGLIHAHEGDCNARINTSSTMESLPGLLALHEATGEKNYLDVSAASLRWFVKNAFMSEKGLVRDIYNPVTRTWEPGEGRPLVEDAVFLIVGRLTKDESMVAAHYRVLERLLLDEDPPGNWIIYSPCSAQRGSLHPRHAYWWAYPFCHSFEDRADERHLQAAIRAGDWYRHAQRADGGLFRTTFRDFNTNSFGHATSGIACAAKLWVYLWKLTRNDEWLTAIDKALNFCVNMQITEPEDGNLKGVIVEKIHPLHGSDRSPIHIRDLGTIFYIQAVCEAARAGLLDLSAAPQERRP